MDDTPSFLISIGGTGTGTARKDARVYLMRDELAKILNIYGKMVAAGVWKDYAIDQLIGQAIFSVHRVASERPLYQIIKEPALAAKQGMWRVTGMNGQILKRGKNLDTVLRIFDSKLIKALN